jgi:hypothetical protein
VACAIYRIADLFQKVFAVIPSIRPNMLSLDLTQEISLQPWTRSHDRNIGRSEYELVEAAGAQGLSIWLVFLCGIATLV